MLDTGDRDSYEMAKERLEYPAGRVKISRKLAKKICIKKIECFV
jgi:hypothetical protein